MYRVVVRYIDRQNGLDNNLREFEDVGKYSFNEKTRCLHLEHATDNIAIDMLIDVGMYYIATEVTNG